MSRLKWKFNLIVNGFIKMFNRTYKGYSDILGITLLLASFYNLIQLIHKLTQFYQDSDLLDYSCINNLFIAAMLLELSIQAFKYGRC